MAWTAVSSQPSKKCSAPSTDSSSTLQPPATRASRNRTLWSCGAIVSAVPCWRKNGGASGPDLRRRARGTGLIEPFADRTAEEVGGERRRIIGIERRQIGQRVPAHDTADCARLRVEADGRGEEAATRLAPHDDARRIAAELLGVLAYPRERVGCVVDGRRVQRLTAEAVVVGDHDESGLHDPLEEAGRPRTGLARCALAAAHAASHHRGRTAPRGADPSPSRVGARRARGPGNPPSRRR